MNKITDVSKARLGLTLDYTVVKRVVCTRLTEFTMHFQMQSRLIHVSFMVIIHSFYL